ncbi:hypothetical protein FH972_021589 [Carpinus fangiana]|uniref:glycerol kinase n=1 Tax=Carpinus fangiana TaxID=176857 RepID=A0A5N6KPR1_9ROSI|nr:hypothetical protein FH972_021589 [Carpinus fangiana]
MGAQGNAKCSSKAAARWRCGANDAGSPSSAGRQFAPPSSSESTSQLLFKSARAPYYLLATSPLLLPGLSEVSADSVWCQSRGPELNRLTSPLLTMLRTGAPRAMLRPLAKAPAAARPAQNLARFYVNAAVRPSAASKAAKPLALSAFRQNTALTRFYADGAPVLTRNTALEKKLGAEKLSVDTEHVTASSGVGSPVAFGEKPEEDTDMMAGIRHDVSVIKDTFALDSVPKEAYNIGLAGVLPYLATSTATVACAFELNAAAKNGGIGYLMNERTAELCLQVLEPLQVGYGAVVSGRKKRRMTNADTKKQILSFLGAIHWGLEWAKFGGTHGYSRYAIGVLAPAVAWPTILLPVEYALIAQFLAFNLLYAVDSSATVRGWTPAWYSSYRFILTLIVGASIVLSLIGRGQVADRIGQPHMVTQVESRNKEDSRPGFASGQTARTRSTYHASPSQPAAWHTHMLATASTSTCASWHPIMRSRAFSMGRQWRPPRHGPGWRPHAPHSCRMTRSCCLSSPFSSSPNPRAAYPQIASRFHRSVRLVPSNTSSIPHSAARSLRSPCISSPQLPRAPYVTATRLTPTPPLRQQASAEVTRLRQPWYPPGIFNQERNSLSTTLEWAPHHSTTLQPSATMPTYIGSIDQGTTSTRFIIFDKAGNVVAQHQLEFKQIYPESGWHEHNPAELLSSVQTCIKEACAQFEKDGHSISDIATIGLTNQRETTICWDASTGETFHNAIAWPDTRTKNWVRELKERKGADDLKEICGLPLSTYPSSVKLTWLLNNDEKVKKAYSDGKLHFGTPDTWLLWNLTGGAKGENTVFVTDTTNASRTMFMNLHTTKYDDRLLDFFNLDRNKLHLPEIVASSHASAFGKFADGPLKGLSITGVLGDQSAALVGQQGFQPGQAKNTYGTGCFLLYNVGEKPVISQHGLLATVAFDFRSSTTPNAPTTPTYALEGSIAVAGSAVKFLTDNLELAKKSHEVTALAESVPDNGGLVFVTAFSGLFAPYWIDDAKGTIFGITQHTNKGHVARATLEATCFQTKAILDAMEKDSGHALAQLAVDGGMSNSDITMQTQANIIGIPVDRPSMRETTSLGSAIAAGFAVGVWSSFDELKQINQKDRTLFEPQIDEKQRSKMYRVWQRAVEMCRGWVVEDEADDEAQKSASGQTEEAKGSGERRGSEELEKGAKMGVDGSGRPTVERKDSNIPVVQHIEKVLDSVGIH